MSLETFKTRIINDFVFIKRHYEINEIAAEILEGMIVSAWEEGFNAGAARAVLEMSN